MSLLIPVFAICLSGLASSLTLAFAKPTSKLRLATPLLSACLTLIFHVSLQGVLDNRLWKALLTTCMWIQWLKSIDDLCLTRISVVDGHRDVKDSKAAPVANQDVQALHTGGGYAGYGTRFKWALSMLWNMRGIGTKWAITKIPPFSTVDKTYVPSRGSFLLRHLQVLNVTYVVLDVFSHQPPDAETMILLSAQKQHLFSRYLEVTATELMFRATVVLAFWINTACIVAMIHSALAVIHVGLFISDPVEWPPIFGPMSEAYTVRHFWGTTWHQTLRRLLTSISGFVTLSILRITKGTIVARYVKLMICFWISGMLHFSADLVLGVPSSESGSVKFFTAQALAIMAEDMVQEVTSQFGGGRKSTWRRYFGFVWVATFLYWMSPTWSYPAARAIRPQKDVLLLFSVIEKVL